MSNFHLHYFLFLLAAIAAISLLLNAQLLHDTWDAASGQLNKRNTHLGNLSACSAVCYRFVLLRTTKHREIAESGVCLPKSFYTERKNLLEHKQSDSFQILLICKGLLVTLKYDCKNKIEHHYMKFSPSKLIFFIIC